MLLYTDACTYLKMIRAAVCGVSHLLGSWIGSGHPVVGQLVHRSPDNQ